MSVNHCLLTAAWRVWGCRVTMRLPDEKWLLVSKGQSSSKRGNYERLPPDTAAAGVCTYWWMRTILVEWRQQTLKSISCIAQIYLLFPLSSHNPRTANSGSWLVTTSRKPTRVGKLAAAIGPEVLTMLIISLTHLDFPHPQSALLLDQVGCLVG